MSRFFRFPSRRPRNEAAPRRRRGRRLALLALLVLSTGASVFIWQRQSRAAAALLPSVSVSQADLALEVESGGAVAPARRIDLQFQASGQVREVLVTPGATVRSGQPLARLDDQDLQLDLERAEANLQTAQARLLQAREGAATPQDLAEAEASVQSAAAQLQKTRTGNVTAADIAEAEAALRSAEANLTKTRTGNYSADDFAQAEADLKAAEAALQAREAGPTAAARSAAERQLQSAQKAYDDSAAAASTAKTDAERRMHEQADSVRGAQDAYSRAYWNDQQAQSGIDPTTGQRFEDQGRDAAIEQRSYADALRQAERQLRQAESALETAQAAYASAQQQEQRDVADAEARLADARVQYEAATAGATEAERASARAQVEQARAKLANMRRGGTAADIAAAQAQVDQARARLQKLRQGGTAADIADAQARVSSAQAGLEELTAPRAPSEVAIAEAGVADAQAQVAAARRQLEQAVLVAPFSGVIAEVNVEPGAVVGSGAGAAFTLVDTATLHLDLAVSESDVARIKPGQPVTVSVDALPDAALHGTVASVAPTADEQQNVVTYLVQITFDPGDSAVKVGMSASASIEVERYANVIQVPSRAIQTEGPSKTVKVLYGSQRTPVTVRVTTGATNGAQTEIVSCVDLGKQCLRPGDQLALSLPTDTAGAADPQGGNQMFVGPVQGVGPGGPPQRIEIHP
jgi:HlyD family secretion protein